MTSPLILYSRSAVTTDWRCPRSRWWNYHYDNKGIVADSTNLALFLGTIVHDGLAAIAHDINIDDIAAAAHKQMYDTLLVNTEDTADVESFANEQATLVEGLLRGFYKHVWPKMMEDYPEVVCIEKELTYPHDGLTFMAREDIILRDKEGCNWYWEYKTTKWSNDNWVNSWPTAVQVHSSIKAIEHTLNIDVAGAIIQGLFKGYVAYGKQTSPFCYAYHRPGDPPFNKERWSYEYAAGLKKYPVWKRDGGVKQWVDEMPAYILAAQFPQVPPIFIRNELVDAFFRQRALREKDIAYAASILNDPSTTAEVKQQTLDASFPQKFDSCQPGFGNGCEYKQLCFGHVDDPLTAGFSYRIPHHTPELEAQNG